MWHLSNIYVFAIVKDTGTELMPTDIKYYQLFGGEKVIFEKEEVTEMKKFGKPGTYISAINYHVVLLGKVYIIVRQCH